jgi:YVTN family beta-propeller protein
MQNGSPVALGAHQQRAVLAILILHAGEIVSADRLVDELWGEQPPPTAAKVVHVYVSRLRKALAAAGGDDGPPIVTHDRGYALPVHADDVDARIFERLLEEGRRAHAQGAFDRTVDVLRQALALWRGPPLADFTFDAFAGAEIARLEELRLEALETYIDADLALGGHAAHVAELERLTAQHPERERLRALHMLALYRGGRQSEALAVYRRTRAALSDELGIEPGLALRELHQAMLRHDAALEPPAVASETPIAETGDGRRHRRWRWGGAAAVVGLVGCVAVAIALLADGTRAVPTTVPVNAVGVIDPAHGRLVDTIAVGARPGGLAATAGSVWVANLDDRTITRIDAARRRVLGAIAPGGVITGLGARGGAVWVADASGVASRVDPALGQVVQVTPRLGLRDGPPESIDATAPVAAAADALWVAHSGVLTRLDAAGQRRLATIPVGNETKAIVVGAGATWVSDDVSNYVLRIVDDAVVDRIATGDGPDGLAVGDGAVWVTNRFDGTVARIDPAGARVTATIPVGAAPSGIAVIGGSVWVANSGDGTLSEIDARTQRVVRTLPVGNSPVALAAVGGRLWVSVQAPAATTNPLRRAAAGGVARFDVPLAPDSLDPALAYTSLASQILYATCAKLYNFPDASGAAGTRVVPEVARGLPAVSPDGLRDTIAIRPGYRLSPPSGAPVTAQTFRHAIERELSPKWHGLAAAPGYLDDIVGAAAFQAGRARHIAGVTAAGDRLVIRLTRPAPDLPMRLSLPFFCAVPDDAPVRSPGIDTLPMAGPYYIRSVIPGRQIVLARNPNYHGPRPRRLDAIDIRIGRSPAAALARIRSGTDDYFSAPGAGLTGFPPALGARLRARYGAANGLARQRFFVNQTNWVDYFALNTTRPLFAHARLRRAVNFAVDRQALTTQPGYFPRRATDQYLPPGMPGFRDVSLYPLDGTDIAAARRLAGRRRRHANLLVCDTPPCPQWAAIIRADLARIGIDVTTQELPFIQMFKREQQPHPSWDLAFFSWGFDFPDPSDVLNYLLHGNYAAGNPNSSRFDDPGYNRRLDAAARLTGPARSAAYAKLDADLAGRAAPMIAFGLPLSEDFFSARIGCQVYQPTYAMDLAALCVRGR